MHASAAALVTHTEMRDSMINRTGKQISLLLIPLVLLATDVWSPAAYGVNQPVSEHRKQKQKRSKGWFCAAAYEIRIVDATGEIVDHAGSAVIVGRLVRRVEPGYPTQAVKERIEGSVVIEAIVSETGDITSIKSVSGPPALTSASTEAAKRWRFSPTTVEGVPVPAIAKLTFRYDLGLQNNAKKTGQR